MKPRYAIFVAHYAEHHNAEQAAIAAGYSVKTARKVGSQLLTKQDIWEAVEEKTRAKTAQIEQEGAKIAVCRSVLLEALPEAIAKLISMLRDPETDRATLLNVVREISDRAGLIKQTENTGPQTIVVTGGLPLDPTK